ncbi:MAG: thiamine pyrophosphate-dependent enzyme, partial [Euryarchaeota archaeon]|nr:thiamine pyrophosphate-dependent enzyme [Euryarchaeota archaeon]
DAEWCINEKVAMEIALGASASGSRSMVIVKHVGMNILADPLITASTHTIGAGVVVVAGDDPCAAASQNEQDSRYWGLLAEVPVLDPNPENLYDTIFEAYRISEAVCTPVIIRVTDPLLQSGCVCRSMEDPERDPSELHLFDRSIWEYSMHGMYQLFHRDTYPRMKNLSETSHLNVCVEGMNGGRDSASCVISSGYVSGTVESILRQMEHIPHLSLSFVSPLPLSLIGDFIGDRRVLVIEETAPVIERQLQLQSRKILGRQSGHLPYGGIGEADILSAIENIGKDEIVPDTTPETLESRGFTRSICDDCPFVPVYEAIRSVKKETGAMIAGDMGCSIRTAPTGVVDLAYSLGGAIGIATGLPGKGIAVIGDYGLVHSGLQALIDAESKGRDVLVIVLQNMVSAMTGGQEVLDPGRIIRACCSDVVMIDETAGGRGIERLITEKRGVRGVSVIVVCGACRRCERLIQAHP